MPSCSRRTWTSLRLAHIPPARSNYDDDSDPGNRTIYTLDVTHTEAPRMPSTYRKQRPTTIRPPAKRPGGCSVLFTTVRQPRYERPCGDGDKGSDKGSK